MIKIYKALPAYYGYLKSMYQANPSMAMQSFNRQLDIFREDCFQWIMSWGKYNTDNDVEVFETIPNCFELQNTWGNGKYALDDKWMVKTVLDQIRDVRPHVCILYSPEVFTKDIIDAIHEIDSKIIIGGYDGMNRQNIGLYNGYDFVITCSEYISKYYRSQGMPTYAMKFGFDPDILKKLSPHHSNIFTVGFSGSIFPGIHDERFNLISRLSHSSNLRVSSDFGYSPNKTILSRHIFREVKDLSPRKYIDYFRIYRRNCGPLYGIPMFQFLQDCDMVLNLHGDKIGFAANIRLFEATGVGTCLLTDWKENIGDLFEPFEEVLTYRSADEAAELIQKCSKDRSFCKRIAEKGQKRTLTDYSYQILVPELIKFVKSFV